jgi:hypothetical protein
MSRFITPIPTMPAPMRKAFPGEAERGLFGFTHGLWEAPQWGHFMAAPV